MRLEAKELRIGNCVYYDGRNCTIQEPTDLIDADEFKPIPLTEEWLLKFGFKSREDNEYGYLRLENRVGDFYVRPSYDGGYYWGFGWSNEINNQRNIKCVHQLQNLYFALTNEELMIK